MPEIPCQFPACTYAAVNDSEAIAIAMFNSHILSHQQSRNTPTTAVKQQVPPISRPEVKQDVNDEDWATFLTEWEHFKRCTDIPTAQLADQLFLCCERGLGRLLIRENPEIITSGEDELLKAMERMAVIKIATSVRRTNLLATKQDHGESFQEFYANVKAAASTCGFHIKCPNTCCADAQQIDYTPLVIKDILVAGIADVEIRKDVLGWSELDAKMDKEVVTFVEEKETAKKAWSGTTTSAAGISGYKKPLRNVEDAEIKRKLSMKGKCSKCKLQISLYTCYRSGNLNKTPFDMCVKCFREAGSQDNATADRDRDRRGRHKKLSDTAFENSAVTSFIGAVNVPQCPVW